jgi:WD40 repeat protein
MPSTVVINLGNGNLAQGFPTVTARLWDDLHPRAEQFIGSLPAMPDLAESYRIWQSTYRALCDRRFIRSAPEDAEDELEIATGGITNVSQVSFQVLSQQLQQQLNDWLQSEGFRHIERQLRSRLQPEAEIRVIFEVNDDLLHRLPWHCWHLLHDYANAEVALSCPEYKRRSGSRTLTARKRVRILAILGNSHGIDVAAERQLLQALPDAETQVLVMPSRPDLNHQLWDPLGWDILFFAGHSQTEGQMGRIYINDNPVHNSLTIDQLGEALNTAIDNGLKLAIFNSCDGVGLAQALAALPIPQVIVMREPVPNCVAQEFFQHFLAAYATDRLPLYVAVRQARRRLQGLEDDFPGASWLPVICQNPAIDPPTWLQLGGMPPCPYQGLFAFQATDADVFFGREQFTQNLVKAVQHKALVAVVGPSGSGKSSVVFAGLVAQLRLRDRSLSPHHIVSFRPSGSPFDALAEALIQEWPEVALAAKDSRFLEPSQALRFRTLELAVELQQDQHALCQRIAKWVQHSPGTRLLLIADQFEELYTLCPEDQRQTFLESLLNAVQLAPAFTLVLTLRADFYGYALSDRRFSDVLQDSVYNLGPMSQAELQRAIGQPAAQRQVQLEAGLADQLMQSTWGHAGRLPLLEFALTQLWARQADGWLTHQAYAEIGGGEAAIANHAEAVYAGLHSVDQRRVQRIFVQLVEPGVGTDPSRRLATRDEVGAANWDLVSHLASSRLVVTNRHAATGEETVEIVHEALLRHWGRLERWLQSDHEFRCWQEDLRQAGRQWEGSGQEDEALLRGKRLLDAQDWYDRRQEEMSSGDRAFIQRSLAMQAREQKQRRRRRQGVMASLLAGLLAALMLAGMAWWGWQNAAIREVKALSTSANALFVSDKRLDALLEALRAWQKSQQLAWIDPETQAQVEGAVRQATYGANERNRLSGHQDVVYGVAFSPDGQLMATASGDKTVKLWRSDGTLLSTLRDHSNGVYRVAFSPDGKLLATASLDGTAILWNREGTKLTTLQGHRAGVYGVAFSPDSQTVATASGDDQIKLWSRDGRLLKTLAGQSGGLYAVAFSPEGQHLVSAGVDGTVKLWQLDGTLIKTLLGHSGSVYGVAFSPEGQQIASVGEDNTVRLWTREGDRFKLLQGHSSRVFGVVFSPDGQTLASASRDQTVKLWRRDGTLLKTLRGHEAEVWAVAFSPDNRTLATGSSDRTVRLWERQDALLTTLVGHADAVKAVAFSPDGQVVATASEDKTVKLWQLNGSLVRTLGESNQRVTSVAFVADGSLAAAGKDQRVRLWQADGTTVNLMMRHGAPINAVAVSPKGQMMATAGDDRTVKLWQRDGKLLHTLVGNRSDVFDVAFSPDGELIAAAGRDQMIRLWKLDGTLVKSFNNLNSEARAIAFSPDGQVMAVASWDQTIKLWHHDGTLFKVLSGHDGKVNDVAFSADGQRLVSASDDKTIKLWRRDGTLINTLKGHSGRVTGVAFSPNGQMIASASEDRTVVLWPLDRVLDLHQLLVYDCDWVNDYLRTNVALPEGDRPLCQSIKSE